MTLPGSAARALVVNLQPFGARTNLRLGERA